MAHHKRKRPKHQRSGCLWCKPWKDERQPKRKNAKPSDRRRMLGAILPRTGRLAIGSTKTRRLPSCRTRARSVA
jgi:hypothetical protein